MANIALGNNVHPELAALLKEIEADESKASCDLPGCDKSHKDVTGIRLRTLRTSCIDLLFCSEEHKQEAGKRWGLLN